LESESKTSVEVEVTESHETKRNGSHKLTWFYFLVAGTQIAILIMLVLKTFVL